MLRPRAQVFFTRSPHESVDHVNAGAVFSFAVIRPQEQIEAGLADSRKENENPEWEKINHDNPGAITDTSKNEKVSLSDDDYDGTCNWIRTGASG